jgi:hypothetical protein
MKCLRIYATPDGESHFGEVDIAMTMTPLFPNEAPLELSAQYPAARVRFVHIPAGFKEAGFHTPPERLLAVWLPVPKQRNSRDENDDVRAGKTPEAWEKNPAKNRQKDKDAR